MIVLEKSSDSRHKLDGSTDERLYRREQAIGFTLKNPVAARIIAITEHGLEIESPRPLNLGDRYPFLFSVGSLRTRPHGEVRWSKLVRALDPVS